MAPRQRTRPRSSAHCNTNVFEILGAISAALRRAAVDGHRISAAVDGHRISAAVDGHRISAALWRARAAAPGPCASNGAGANIASSTAGLAPDARAAASSCAS